MSRKVRRVPVSLNPCRIDHLPEAEIRLILRGADDLLMRGGRTLLAKLLKGSRDRKILERGLNASPAYGAYRELTLEEITARIDWLIVNDYLAIEYDYRLPLLVYTRRGWAIERETYTDELMDRIDALLAETTASDTGWLKDTHHEVRNLLLERIGASHDTKYAPFLEAWASVSGRKSARKIHAVVNVLRGV